MSRESRARCDKCGVIGHFKKRCPERPKGAESRASSELSKTPKPLPLPSTSPYEIYTKKWRTILDKLVENGLFSYTFIDGGKSDFNKLVYTRFGDKPIFYDDLNNPPPESMIVEIKSAYVKLQLDTPGMTIEDIDRWLGGK